MSRECSGGGTRIVVNGRELSKKDLAFLGKKGLLELPGANYTLEADGTVVDNVTGKTMRPLGKL